jgi:hypothetical protein
MSFFRSFLETEGLEKHDGRPLWKYKLTEEQIHRLTQELIFDQPSIIDPRDVTLYYANWWKSHYNGGIPSKQVVFESLGGNSRFNLDDETFYTVARQGAQMLGLKWIKKQNTLYFRTLLLQGGLPIKHIAANHGAYQNFLLAVLEEQPETIDDFIFQPQIINLLPKSSQNDIIYESCFEIVKSILNKENLYDDLLTSNEELTEITRQLKIRKQSLVPRERLSKPQNYWLLKIQNDEPSLVLKIGFADTYNFDSLTNILGFEATGNDYQFYMNDRLICVFRKMLNGHFKTDWHSQQDERWDGQNSLPYAYVIENGKKVEVKDFIQIIPNLHEPSLWTKHSEIEWRLIKGSGTPNKEVAILYPTGWNTTLQSETITIYEKVLSWAVFEGEALITSEGESRRYLSEVNSIDWTIISQKPNWMLKSSMPVVKGSPRIIVYDENNRALTKGKYQIWVKSQKHHGVWEDLSTIGNLPLGCIDIKIEKEGLITYDSFFNIGNLQLEYLHSSIDNAEIEIRNIGSFVIKLDESPIMTINENTTGYSLKVRTEFSKIPTGIQGSVGYPSKKKLYFELVSPFEGMEMVDKEGQIIGVSENLSLSNLYGIRILSTPNQGLEIRLMNSLKHNVRITKEITVASFPLISLREEILRLYYLGDAMNYKNKVSIELKEGRYSKKFEVSLFTHTLNVENQNSNSLTLYNSDSDLDLFAIPLNCRAEDINLIPLLKQEGVYEIPNTEITNQFIVISSLQGGDQLMPRFVNTDENYCGIDKNERIEGFHSQLLTESFDHQIWKQLHSYFNICIENQIPFSSIDQIIAVSRSSEVVAKAFFFLGVNQYDTDEYIQKYVFELERDLGFSFHWVKTHDWGVAMNEICQKYELEFDKPISHWLAPYLQENNLSELLHFMNNSLKEVSGVYNYDISSLREALGAKVLSELPNSSPRIIDNYNIPIDEHIKVRLLIQAPIAVAESITDRQREYPIWGGGDNRDKIRRNIQYSQYLNPEFYKKVLLHALKN